MCKKQILSCAFLLGSTTLLQSADNSGSGWMGWFSWRKKNTTEVVSATQPVDQAEPSVNQLQPVPRAIVEADLTLDFGDNAFALYEFDGRDNKLTACYIAGAEYYPLFFEYPDNGQKSWGVNITGQGSPMFAFDDSTTVAKIPQSDMRVYRFEKGHKTFIVKDKTMVWSAYVPITKPVMMHNTLPYFAVGDKNLITIYNNAIFTQGDPVEPLCIIPVKDQETPSMAWHPAENKLLLISDEHMIAEYNGDSKKIEKQFPLPKKMWLMADSQHSAYVLATKQIVSIGGPAGTLRKLYELRENAEPRKLPIEFVGNTNKEICYNKIVSVVRNYLVLECMFSSNPRFLGVCDLKTNKLYNVHDFRTEIGSIIFDPATLKFFEMGHRVYFGYPGTCQVYNRECSIIKVELS